MSLIDSKETESVGDVSPAMSEDSTGDELPAIPEDEEFDAEKLDEDVQDELADAINEDKDVMLEIIMQIKEDDEYAKSIYKNCARLQKLLDENPDLRPIFENPKFVLINFEKVYRDSGGVLPWDEEEEEEKNIFTRVHDSMVDTMSIITSHPIFKIFKIFMIVKKVMGFLSPSKGIGMIKGFFQGILEDPDAEPPDGDIDGGPDGDGDFEGNPSNLESRMQLNAAAEHMEDPEVSEKMDKMLENPDNIEEAIENDPELKALQDDPLCSALMEDPETMKILVDPENLRALGQAPDLIEQDFMNPFEAEIPEGPDVADVDVDAPEVDAEVPEIDADAEADIEVEENEEGDLYDDMTEDIEKDDDGNEVKKGKQKKEEKDKDGNKAEAQGWLQAAAGVVGGNLMESLGVGEMDLNFMDGGDELLGDGGEGLLGDGEFVETPMLEGQDIGAENLTSLEGLDEIAGDVEEIEPGGIEAPEIELGELEIENDGKETKNKGKKDGDGGGAFSMVGDAVGGMVMGSLMASVVGDDGMDMVDDFQENLEEQEKEGDENNTSKRGHNVFSAAKDLVTDTLIGDTLAAVVGDDLADNILDTQEDIELLEDDDDDDDKEQDTRDDKKKKK
mmetsp:Transcript_5479/g.7930  ORF Transcript_5479/g.7930 Transcript_5479/m.7930 type:complete len:618 (+) Transcript_5479:25-1878(+)